MAGNSGAGSLLDAVVGLQAEIPPESDDEYESALTVEVDMDSGHEGELEPTDPVAVDPEGSLPQSVAGMLLRDIPKHTPFYDPVAERQMSQTDAKLFYQRSQTHLLQHQTALSASPQASPTMAPSFSYAQSPPTLHQPPSQASPHMGPGLPPPASVFAAPASEIAHHEVQGGHRAPGMRSGEAPPFSPSLQANPIPADNDPHVAKEFTSICENIHRLIALRRKYMAISLQRDGDSPKDEPGWVVHPPPPDPAWRPDQEGTGSASRGMGSLSNSMVLHSDGSRLEPEVEGGDAASSSLIPPTSRKTVRKRKPGHDIGEDFDMDDFVIPGPDEGVFHLDNMGVYQVFENAEAQAQNRVAIAVPTIKEFYVDLDFISSAASDGPSKSFAFRRLQYLESRFNLFVIQNGYQEIADSKRVPHRDFYNVRKVDTHVHHSACMNQKHLLRFIKSKLKKCPHEKVIFRDGKHLSLTEVFESIKLTAYDLSIDTLDMHAHTDSFHRFDKFNLKYNPVGESRLRTIFLKTDNDVQGRYLAEITKEVIADLESSKYQMVEWRISIYGKTMDEWDKLAAWVVDNKLFSPNVRWLVQIPRLFDVYKASNLMENFEQTIKNIFQPLFEVTANPQSHPKLHVFLQRVIGFDSVDDESKVERRLFKKFPVPREWQSKQNPPYSYWIYYLFANTASLNNWRKKRGFNTLVIRPHCGEAGDSDHLSAAALACHSISHGLLLRKVPLLQYIFYLEQIGIAMSPLSNNALFLAYERNPFHQYFKRGLNVSLSTDDPLQFSFTKEPLIEEYAVAAQIYKLSPVDMCELAKNSVQQSGYEHSIKQLWLGERFELPGKGGNDMVKTNVPNIRKEFRYQLRSEEWQMLGRYVSPSFSGRVSQADAIPPVTTMVSRSPSQAAMTRKGDWMLHDSHELQQHTPVPQVKTEIDARSRATSTMGLNELQRVTTATPSMVGFQQTPGVSKESQWTADMVPFESSPRIAQNDLGIFPGLVSRTTKAESLGKDTMHDSALGNQNTNE